MPVRLDPGEVRISLQAFDECLLATGNRRARDGLRPGQVGTWRNQAVRSGCRGSAVFQRSGYAAGGKGFSPGVRVALLIDRLDVSRNSNGKTALLLLRDAPAPPLSKTLPGFRGQADDGLPCTPLGADQDALVPKGVYDANDGPLVAVGGERGGHHPTRSSTERPQLRTRMRDSPD